MRWSGWVQDWDMQHREGILVGPLQRETHNLIDVTRFMFTFQRRRRSKAKVSVACSAFMTLFRSAFVAWLARVADRYALETYLRSSRAEEQPAPSIKHRRPGKRKYTLIGPEAQWDLMALAREERANAGQALALRSDQPDLGSHPNTAASWTRKSLEMYWIRCQRSLSGQEGPGPSSSILPQQTNKQTHNRKSHT